MIHAQPITTGRDPSGRTREGTQDAVESLLSGSGCVGISVRDTTMAAGVNLAAINAGFSVAATRGLAGGSRS